MNKSRWLLNSCSNNTSFARALPKNCFINYPAALLGLLLLSACHEPATQAEPPDVLCQGETTPIAQIQGEDWYSPQQGKNASIRGIVTQVESGHGLYLEETATGKPGKSSNAIFVLDDNLSDLTSPGQELFISGLVTESGSARDKMTTLSDITSHQVCSESHKLPLTEASLPMNSRQREALEGMRLGFRQGLTVTDVYNHHRGELTLSSNGVLRVPTETQQPGADAMKLERENRERALEVILLKGSETAYPAGTVFQDVLGLMGHNGKEQQLLIETMAVYRSVAIQSIEPPTEGQIRIVSTNLLNFFNGDGAGGGFPTERGAETPAEFQSQKERMRAAFGAIQADLLGVQELENDGFGPRSAARELLELLDEAGGGPWAFVAPGEEKIGGDVITDGIFYRQTSLEIVGVAQILDSKEFQGLSRYVLAQALRDKATGERFLVAVNHLKSKGRCPDSGANTDQHDGQGCWNAARVAAVEAQTPWLNEVAKAAGTDRILVLGDMNAWRNEDPIQQFRSAGYSDLVEALSGLPQHSYLYWGQTGTFDYAFASAALLQNVTRAKNWNINAAWPGKMPLPQPWLRMSDHDPVVVDVDFSQSATSD